MIADEIQRLAETIIDTAVAKAIQPLVAKLDVATAYAGHPLLLTPSEAAKALSLGTTAVYNLMGKGLLPYVQVGKSRRLPLSGLHGFIEAELLRQGFQA